MKTTVELPDDLMRAIKLRAVREDRKLKELIAELLRRGLDDRPNENQSRVEFPLIRGGHPARREEELLPERVATILLDQETRDIASR